MLYIRADGNADIGMGHVMRCLSVAEAAADIDRGPGVVFITADDGCCGMIEDRGFAAVVLDTDYKDMLSELPKLEKMLDRDKDVLLVDSYQVSGRYYAALGKLVKVACLEDMGEAYPVDLLINYNIYAPGLKQHYKAQGYDGKMLLGVSYMPLRKAFQVPSAYVVSDKVAQVTITTGGSDPYFAAGAFADAFLADSFLSEQNIRWHIISGPFNQFAESLKNRYQDCRNVTVHENVKDMRSLLLQSDVVVTATGSTIYEVSSLGVPMIVFYFAENQRQGAETLEKLTDIVNAGCFADDSRSVTDRAANALRKCIEHRDYRMLLHQQEKQFVDGKGALRIADELIKMMA